MGSWYGSGSPVKYPWPLPSHTVDIFASLSWCYLHVKDYAYDDDVLSIFNIDEAIMLNEL